MLNKRVKKKISKNPQNAVFIINPVSGIGDHTKRKQEIITNAKALGWDGTIVETTKSKDAGLIATEQINKGKTHLVICGGDGTIMEALQAVLDKNVVLGIVPLGTGNLFAQNLHLTGSKKDIIKRALFGTPQKIDVGRANGTIFAIIAGIGFDAEIMRSANRKLKDRFGLLAYILIALKRLYRRPTAYRITIDQKPPKIIRAKSIMIANMGKLQGGIEAVPKAHWQNGVLRIGIIRASAFPEWINIVGNALIGNINRSPHYQLFKAKSAIIEPLSGKRPYQCDGNHFAPTRKLAVEVIPQTVTVLVDKNLKTIDNNPFSSFLHF